MGWAKWFKISELKWYEIDLKWYSFELIIAVILVINMVIIFRTRYTLYMYIHTLYKQIAMDFYINIQPYAELNLGMERIVSNIKGRHIESE